MTIDQETLDALKSITVRGQQTTMPQLDRALYVKVNKALECLGGKWDKKAKAHVWDCDPGDPIADAVTTGEVRDWKKELQFFPTPPGLAARVVASARIENGHVVLEPSAGKGALIAAIREVAPRCHLLALDLDMKLVDGLKLANGCQAVYCADFLSIVDEFGQFDRVVMNPPFTKGHDISHVAHAWGMLKPGGRLVAITAPGWTFRTDAKHAAFRALVEEHGESQEIPAGTFMEAGTAIRTMLVILNKPGVADKPTPEEQAEASGKPAAAFEASTTPESTPKAAKTTPAKPRARREATARVVRKVVATEKAHKLREKLEALVERGINGERDAAKLALARLLARVDFSKPRLTTPDLFAGVFQRANVAAPIMPFASEDWDIANGIKWAIEKEARIPCCWRDGSLMAEAAPETASRLHSIAATVATSFRELWRQFAAAPGVNQADRGLFTSGLADGMLDEVRTGTALPSRPARPRCAGKAKAKAVAAPRGVVAHPYSVAAGLGRQIRFNVPLVTVAGELEKTIKGELE